MILFLLKLYAALTYFPEGIQNPVNYLRRNILGKQFYLSIQFIKFIYLDMTILLVKSSKRRARFPHSTYIIKTHSHNHLESK